MPETATILVVDDNPEMREILGVLLSGEGYRVREARTGEEALNSLGNEVDLIVLDVMMPDCSGFDICSRMRERSRAPILFLTARSMEGDRERGLECGGDDYLVKPFSASELTARVKALLRRYFVYRGKDEERKRCRTGDDLELAPSRKSVLIRDSEVHLTDTEFAILSLLLSDPRKIFSAREIFESVWEEPFLPTSNNTVMVHIKRLREKVEADCRKPRRIVTVWGKGYRIV